MWGCVLASASTCWPSSLMTQRVGWITRIYPQAILAQAIFAHVERLPSWRLSRPDCLVKASGAGGGDGGEEATEEKEGRRRKKEEKRTRKKGGFDCAALAAVHGHDNNLL